MAYATLEQLRESLTQLRQDTPVDNMLTAMLEEAASIIDGALGFSYLPVEQDWTDVTATARHVRAEASEWFHLPPYQQGSITALALYQGAAVTDYEEAWWAGRFYLYRLEGWRGDRYTITAKWGFGPAPESIRRLNIELAVNIWRTKDKGSFTEIVGVEGSGGIRYIGGLNAQQKMIIQNEQRKFREPVV